MKKLNDVNELNALKGEDIINWCQELSNQEKEALQKWMEETGKTDFMNIKHYLGHRFYPHFYKDKPPKFRELLTTALRIN